MTVNELIVELRKQQKLGRGTMQVSIRRHGDTHCMPAQKVKAYGPDMDKPFHVVISAPNPALLWPTGEEQEAVCTNDEAMYESVEDRQKWADIKYHWENS